MVGLHVSVRVYTKIMEETQEEMCRQFEWRKQENEGGKVVERDPCHSSSLRRPRFLYDHY